MWVCYLLVNNFGWAIIIFTLLIKLAMFPLNLKQQKNMAVSQLFAPRVKEIQTKYRNNREKQQEEMTKLQQEGYNPMGGCGTMLVTFLVLFGVIDVVYKPMTHMEHLDWGNDGAINTVVSTAKNAEYASIILSSTADTQAVMDFLNDAATLTLINDNAETTDVNESNQIVISVAEGETFNIDEKKNSIKLMSEDYKASYEKLKSLTDEQIATLSDKTSKLSVEVKNALGAAKSAYANTLYRELTSLRTYQNHDDVFANVGLSADVQEKLKSLSQNMFFAGINLGLVPTFAWDVLVIIPTLAFIMSIAQTIITQYIQKKTNPMAAQMGGSMKAVFYLMPLFSLYISFVVPAGVGFYWAISYVFGIGQSIATYKLWPTEKLQADAVEKLKLKKKNLPATATVVDVDESGNEVKTTKTVGDLSQKELKEYQRRKIEEARKADAMKYGDEEIPELPPIEDEKAVDEISEAPEEKKNDKKSAKRKD